MKKEESKSIKKARKTVRKDLFEKLTLELKELIDKKGYDAAKTGKEVKKAANYLAKKLSQKAIVKITAPKPEKNGKPVAERVAAPAKAVKEKAAVAEEK